MSELTEDKKQFALRTMSDLQFNISYMMHLIKENKLDSEIKKATLSLVESNCAGILKTLDYQSLLISEREDRHKMIRNLNEKNRELECKLEKSTTQKFDPIFFVDVLSNVQKFLEAKWDNRESGLDGLVKIEVKEQYSYIEFIPLFFCHSHSSTTPDTTKKEFEQFINKLKSKGWVFVDGKDELVFNDKNITSLRNFIKTILPTGDIVQIKNINHSGRYRIKSVIVSMPLKDLINESK